MKILKNLNTIVITIPLIVLLCYPIFKDGVIIFSLLSTIITGFIQLIIGIYFWYINPKNLNIKIYFLLVTMFFGLITFKGNDNWFWVLPPFLCLYISIIIYNQKENE